MSAHVVHKAPPFSSDDEDEKTTIESGGWEEEASTTVEQGEVADKLRALGLGAEQRRPNTSITSTNGAGMSDEPTVDDQRGAAALAMLPPPMLARLVITQGNDAGQAIEVRLGKTYTIGRGIDNDLVLTDIAVSRKHFDIRAENGAWVLSDRGSGNGTLVNNRLEDAPFMLASGDVIEIGNTSFRFDLPNGAPRTKSAFDAPGDDDLELSTISGKPLPIAQPLPIPLTPPVLPAAPIPPPGPTQPLARPKTLPPPSPLPRPRTQSRQVVGYALDRPGDRPGERPGERPPRPPTQPPPPPMALMSPQPQALLQPPLRPIQGSQPMPIQNGAGLPLSMQPLPQTTLPMPQMAGRGLPPAAIIDMPMSTQPTTIPGQGPPLPPSHLGHPAHPARLPFAYPTQMNGQGHGQMNGQGHGALNGQGAMPGPLSNQMNGHGQVDSGRPSQRGPMMIASGRTREAPSTALVQPISYSNGQAAVAPPSTFAGAPPLSRRVKLVLGGIGLALFAALATIAIIKGTSSSDPGDLPDPGASGPTKPTSAPLIEPIGDPKPSAPIKPTKGKPAAIKPVSPGTAAVTPVAPPPTRVAVASPPVVTPVAPPPTPAVTAPVTPPPVVTPAPPPVVTPAPPPVVTPVPPPASHVEVEQTVRVKKPDPKKPDSRKPDAKRPAIATRVEPERVETPAASKPDRKHGGKSIQDVKNDANALYRTKNFSGAAQLITAALPSVGAEDAQELKSLAAIYSQLGKAYNVGMAPGTKSTEAYVALRRAIDFDRDVGAAFVGELQEHQAAAASRAASSYMAAKEYDSAFQAVRISDSYGSTSSNNKIVRSMLEDIASNLLRDAQGSMTTDPDGAKKKLRQILSIVEPKNPLHAKAQKLLNGS